MRDRRPVTPDHPAVTVTVNADDLRIATGLTPFPFEPWHDDWLAARAELRAALERADRNAAIQAESTRLYGRKGDAA